MRCLRIIQKTQSVILLGVFACTAFALLACGSESGTEPKSIPTVSEVDTQFELGKCTNENEGISVRVRQENIYYICTNDNWLKIESINSEIFSSSSIVESSSYTFVNEGAVQNGFSSAVSFDEQNVESSSSANRTNYIIDSFTDSRDMQTYKTVTIGTQTWMAENLNYDYNVGSALSYCYNDSASYCKKYGRLYTWSAAMDSAALFDSEGQNCGLYTSISKCYASKKVRGACPSGWHLPDSIEYANLFFAVTGSYTIEEYKYANSYNLCYRLKSKNGWKNYTDYYGTDYEEVKNGNGSDAFGFSALPSGTIYDIRNNRVYSEGLGKATSFWSIRLGYYSTPDFFGDSSFYSAIPYSLMLGLSGATFIRGFDPAAEIFASIRCIKD